MWAENNKNDQSVILIQYGMLGWKAQDWLLFKREREVLHMYNEEKIDCEGREKFPEI